MATYKDNAFPAVSGQLNLTTQTGLSTGTYLCAEDGDLLIHYVGGDETLSCKEGDAFEIISDSRTATVLVDIESGKFHKA